MPGTEASADVYSSWVGLIYVFNLIVGTGALTLPSVYAQAGWLLGTILIIGLAFMGFVTVTFIIETMACANATIQLKKLQSHKIDNESEAAVDSESEEDVSNEETAIIGNRNMRRYYSLNYQVELGEMTALYFNKIGRIIFYISLCIYLYGDLAIYAAAVSKSLCDLICPNNNSSGNATDEFSIDCFHDNISRVDLYKILVGIFACLIGPFTYFNVQKTKYLQLATTAMRWCAFTVMITLAIVRLIKFGPTSPPMVNFNGIPALLGASVYSFMCHHSLPGLVAPFNDKRYILRQLGLDYVLICSFYILLALTGIFAFNHIFDLYTSNFVPTGNDSSGIFMQIVMYFLGLFPVFTLSTSFPIIAITLQNNLKTLFLDPNRMDSYSFILKRLTFPTLAVGPPIIVALFTHDVRSLVKFTGSYAGACIQYVIPALLVWQARRICKRDISGAKNKYASPFRSAFWVPFVICWSAVCIILVTVHLF